jgi:hypothetical protein
MNRGRDQGGGGAMAPNHTAYLGMRVHVMVKVEGPQTVFPLARMDQSGATKRLN